jgi:CTP:molybdopterin cytidylyltransferase MocA
MASIVAVHPVTAAAAYHRVVAIAIVPAAGASRRMGRPKLLLPYAGTTILGATAAALRDGGCTRLVLVTAPDDSRLRDWAHAEGATVAVNLDPERGMLTSVWAALAALGGAPAVAFAGAPLAVAPADLPRLAPGTVRAVLAALAPPTSAALAWPRCRGRNGHPLAFAARLAPEVLALDPAVGLRALRERHRADSAVVDVDDHGAVDDVDTPADYRALGENRTP